MKIREGTAADSEWILHHRVEMFRDMGKAEDFLHETSELTKRFLQDNWMQYYRYFIVEENDTVVGGCGLSTFRVPPMTHQKTGCFAYLSNMYIEPEHRRKGFGRALVKYIVQVCERDGFGLLLLHASEVGRILYESEGFNTPQALMQLITARSSV